MKKLIDLARLVRIIEVRRVGIGVLLAAKRCKRLRSCVATAAQQRSNQRDFGDMPESKIAQVQLRVGERGMRAVRYLAELGHPRR